LDQAASQRLLRHLQAHSIRQSPGQSAPAPVSMRNLQLAAILAALKTALLPPDAEQVVIDIQRHGRHDLATGCDLSRTIAYFSDTTRHPLPLPGAKNAANKDYVSQVQQAIQSQQQQIPGFSALRYMSQDPARQQILTALPEAQIAINFLEDASRQRGDGHAGVEFITAQMHTRSYWQSPLLEPHYLLYLMCHFMDQELTLSVVYSEKIFAHSRIEDFGQAFLRGIEMLAAQALEPAFSPD
ncbi:MAG: hypothetical protein RL748_3264, partial [Pseudomonadota bacterium]